MEFGYIHSIKKLPNKIFHLIQSSIKKEYNRKRKILTCSKEFSSLISNRNFIIKEDIWNHNNICLYKKFFPKEI